MDFQRRERITGRKRWTTVLTSNPKEVSGYHTSGTQTVNFSQTRLDLQNGIGWFQWGAETSVLGECVELTEKEVQHWREKYGY